VYTLYGISYTRILYVYCWYTSVIKYIYIYTHTRIRVCCDAHLRSLILPEYLRTRGFVRLRARVIRTGDSWFKYRFAFRPKKCVDHGPGVGIFFFVRRVGLSSSPSLRNVRVNILIRGQYEILTLHDQLCATRFRFLNEFLANNGRPSAYARYYEFIRTRRYDDANRRCRPIVLDDLRRCCLHNVGYGGFRSDV